MKFIKAIGFVLLSLFIIGAIAGKSPTQRTGGPIIEASAQEVMPPLPGNERGFLDVISSFHSKYESATNDFQKGAVYRSRAEALRKALGGGLAVSGWIGKVYKLDSNGDGHGIVEITLSEDAWVRTWNNSFSDMSDHTLIQPSSPLYNKLAALNEGDIVVFSGALLPAGDADVVKTTDLGMSSKMTEPEFLFRFTSIDKRS